MKDKTLFNKIFFFTINKWTAESGDVQRSLIYPFSLNNESYPGRKISSYEKSK
jgi:hypothetical protein